MDNSYDIHYLRKIVEANANMIRLQARVAEYAGLARSRVSNAVTPSPTTRVISEENAGINDIATLLYHS